MVPDSFSLGVIALSASLAGLVLACGLTGLMRRYALAAQLFDTPNDRSMHTVPTPRGGGVAIVVSFAALAVGLQLLRALPPGLLTAMLGCGGLVAVVGYMDDRRPLPARWRFMAHTAAAIGLLWVLPSIPPVPVFGVAIDLGWFGPGLAALYVVWMINLFNFMDGIDGIASVEVITTTLGGALLWWWTGGNSGWVAAVVFAGCAAGFLIWNFPPAKIFMGDAGSGFVGLMVALLSLWCGQANPVLFWSWFILIGCFMVDATTTLVRRVRRGERFFEAHRAHAYQYASRRAGRHLPVTLAVAAITLAWLMPLASAVALGWLDGLVGVTIAYAPLIALAFHFKAGHRAAQEV